jgi:hypothetical protein
MASHSYWFGVLTLLSPPLWYVSGYATPRARMILNPLPRFLDTYSISNASTFSSLISLLMSCQPWSQSAVIFNETVYCCSNWPILFGTSTCWRTCDPFWHKGLNCMVQGPCIYDAPRLKGRVLDKIRTTSRDLRAHATLMYISNFWSRRPLLFLDSTQSSLGSSGQLSKGTSPTGPNWNTPIIVNSSKIFSEWVLEDLVCMTRWQYWLHQDKLRATSA